jgi:hypothetical protein
MRSNEKLNGSHEELNIRGILGGSASPLTGRSKPLKKPTKKLVPPQRRPSQRDQWWSSTSTEEATRNLLDVLCCLQPAGRPNSGIEGELGQGHSVLDWYRSAMCHDILLQRRGVTVHRATRARKPATGPARPWPARAWNSRDPTVEADHSIVPVGLLMLSGALGVGTASSPRQCTPSFLGNQALEPPLSRCDLGDSLWSPSCNPNHHTLLPPKIIIALQSTDSTFPQAVTVPSAAPLAPWVAHVARLGCKA